MGTYAKMVEYYTRKTLTYPNDILRAFTGALNSFYSSRTAFGLPWGDFDRAILWYVNETNDMPGPSKEVDTFPSWSWISVSGQKQFLQIFPQAYGLAYWANIRYSAESSFNLPHVDIAKPTDAELSSFGRRTASWEKLPRPKQACVMAGLAWQAGCLQAHVPDNVKMDCSFEEYRDRLNTRWPTYTTYWEDALGCYDANKLFSASDIDLASHPGRLMVHAQRASFKLDRSKLAEETYPPGSGIADGSSMRGYDRCDIRSATGRLVGAVHFDQHDAQRSVSAQGGMADFIALSISPQNPELYEHDINEDFVPWTTELFGCPCHSTAQDTQPDAGMSHGENDFRHIEECDKHPNFSEPLPYQQDLRNMDGSTPLKHHAITLSKHFAGASYFDVNGRLMHDWWDPPALRVMMIVPSTGKGTGMGVYERVGLGRIYLKRWAEANPRFETVVLE